MKKILILLLLVLSFKSYSQNYCQDTVVIRLIDGNGVGRSGLTSSNIKFRYAPYSSNIAGLTVQSYGSQGNYRIFPFTTFGKVELYINDTLQNWYGRQLVGCASDYYDTRYPRLSLSNTFTGATNQFEAALFHDDVYFEGLATGQDFEMEPLSNLYLWVDAPGNGTLIWKRYADSVYGIKQWYLDGTKIRLNSGYQWYGRTSTTSPIPLNTTQFSWTGDKLNLISSFLNGDSSSTRRYTNYINSTWLNLGEPISKYRMITLGKRFWAYPTSPGYYDWYWYIQSVSESNTISGKDSVLAINNIFSVDNEINVDAGYDATYIKLDSLVLGTGTYMLSFGVLFEKPDFNDANVINIVDTVDIALKLNGSPPNTYIARNLRNIQTYSIRHTKTGGEINWSVSCPVIADNSKIYLYGRYHATDLSNALGLGPTVKFTRARIIATLVK